MGVFVALMVAALIFSTMYGMIAELTSETAYDLPVNDSYLRTFNQTNDVAGQISEDYKTIWGSKEENKTGMAVDKLSYLALVPEIVSLVKNMVKLPYQLTEDMVSGILQTIGLPEFMQPFIMTLILVALIFSIFAIILRYRYV
jgi:hypothetical protein